MGTLSTIRLLGCALSVCALAHAQMSLGVVAGTPKAASGLTLPSFISNCSATGSSSAATCSLSTTGGKLIYVGASLAQGGTPCTLTGSPSITFTTGTSYQPVANVIAISYYIFSPATSSGQVLTLSCASGEPAFTAIVFGGTFGGSVEGATGTTINGGTSSITTGSTGLLTGVPYEVCATHLGLSNAVTGMSLSIGSGFASPFSAGTTTGFLPSGDSYLIPSASTALDPTWSWTDLGTSGESAALIECFK
jgi:hypothetical protein